MDKLITLQTKNDNGIFLYTVGEGRDHGYLTKTACGEFHPDIRNYIDQAQKIHGKTQVLLTALGAGEFYGSNINGDFFPVDALRHVGDDYGFKTFEKMAKVYKHHVNKEPQKSYGDVALSVWNDRMKRVELIVIIDNEKAPDLVDRIDNGEYPEVSMGCRVPYDVCSICGNKAKTRANYCDHLRYHMNKIPPGFSKKAYAINTLPKFFDISFVLIGADRIARVMKKVASVEGSSAPSIGLSRTKLAGKKIAEIKKIIPSNIEPNTVQNIEELGAQAASVLRPLEPNLPKKVIIRITSMDSPGVENLNRVLSTMGILGIAPKPEEFQSIALRSLGRSDLADQYESMGIVFDPSVFVPQEELDALDSNIQLSPAKFDREICESLKPFLEDRSYARPLLHKRVVKIIKLAEAGRLTYPKNEHVKTADDERKSLSILPMMLTLAGLYAALGKKIPDAAMSGIDKVLVSNPALLAALGVGTMAGMHHLTHGRMMGKFDQNPNEAPYRDLSWQEDLARKNANPILKTAGVASRLFLGVPGIYLASGMQTVKRARNPQEQESSLGAFIRKNPDVASTLLVGEALAGRPVTGRVQKLLGGLSMLKKADIGDDVKSTAIFTLAFPGVSMGVRGASMAIDQALLSGIEKLVKRRNKTTK